jgi:hypothetical protein
MSDNQNMSQMAELPQWGIATGADNNLYLTVGVGMMWFQAFLCEPDKYEETARKIHKGIMDAGREARRAKSGLLVAKGPIGDGRTLE